MNLPTRIAFTVAAVLVATSLAAQPPAARSAKVDRLMDRAAEIAQPLVDRKVAVGLAIGILHGNDAVTRGVGRVRTGDDARPNGDTVYEIGSITKVFTGILLAEATALERVKLEDPVKSHLPAAVEVPTFEGQPIRLVHLSTHTSGLPRMPGNFRPKDRANPYADYDAPALYACLANTKLDRAPGSAWAYSNLGAGLLGHTLTRVHGKKRYEEILVRVTGPLKLADTAITLSPSLRARLASPYRAGGAASRNWDLNVLAGAGAIRSTANDLLRFARHNLAAREVDGGIRAALAAAQRPRFRPTPEQRASRMPRMGLGWIQRGDVIWHNGGTGGYRAHLLIHRKRKFAVVVLANTTSRRVDELARRIARLIQGHEVKPL